MSFDGTPAEYTKFRRSFDLRVRCKPFTDSFKLSQLLMLTTGNAHKAIMHLDGTREGYAKALDVLKDRFGRPYQIVKSCLEKITFGKRIGPHDPKGLLEYSDHLNAVYETLSDIDLLREADTQTTLKAIFERLPPAVQVRWAKMVSRMEEEDKFPQLKDLVEYVKNQAKMMNHVVFEVKSVVAAAQPSAAAWKNRTMAAFPPKVKVTTLSTQAASEEMQKGEKPGGGKPQCKFCRQEHLIIHCQKFEKEEPAVRRRFARNTMLCYGCLGRYKIKHWRKKRLCKSCGGDHHSLLHTPSRGASGKGQEESIGHRTQGADGAARPTSRQDRSGQTKTHSQTVGSVVASKPGKDAVLLKVVPVRVIAENGRSFTTCGLPDTGSSTTLITRELADALKMARRKETIMVNTVLARGQRQDVSVCSCSLQPVGANQSVIPVNKAYIVADLYINNKYHPKSVDLSACDQLREIEFSTTVDFDSVTVLIGENVPTAHAVPESRYGEEPHNQPYAVRTPLGWCVAGPTNELASPGMNVSYVGMSQAKELGVQGGVQDVDLTKAVEKLWGVEKLGIENTGVQMMSVEDRRSFAMLESGTRQTDDGHYEIGLLWKSSHPVLPNNPMLAEKR
ncbi:uncharacterized protein LOC135484971 [Lineus longissimus]|uniref:uncharacterized protein LOC135484971 n=1 Tax=Lineus longissimus TaxID=88925 RepID=UPI00315DD934